MPVVLHCIHCDASAPATSKTTNRFLARHGDNCKRKGQKEFTKQLAQGTRSVDEDQDYGRRE